MSEEKNKKDKVKVEVKAENASPQPQPQPEPQPPIMETHAHHLHKAPSHGWKHYLFEFLMLFLAVFAGFLAENKRENIVEHKRAKEFASSLVKDIKLDTADLQRNIRERNAKIKRLDSLMDVLSNAPNPQYDSLLNRLCFWFVRRTYFTVTDATWQQVKSSGALRYINHNVADSLIKYETDITELIRSGNTESTEIKDFTPTVYTILNANFRYSRIRNKEGSVPGTILKMKEDADTRNLIFNYAIHFRNTSNGFISSQQNLLNKATNLIALIKKEYRLE